MSACSCGKVLKSSLQCGICQTLMCKSCTSFPEADQFAFMSNAPEKLTHSAYCHPCFSEHVAPVLDEYRSLMEQAKEIAIYEKSQGKETRFLKRKEKPVKVERCSDYNETLMRLAFLAVKAGYNGLIDVDIKSEKVRQQSYQTTLWSGTGIPTQVDSKRIVRDRSIWQNPN